jgi:hypothetical protein
MQRQTEPMRRVTECMLRETVHMQRVTECMLRLAARMRRLPVHDFRVTYCKELAFAVAGHYFASHVAVPTSLRFGRRIDRHGMGG